MPHFDGDVGFQFSKNDLKTVESIRQGVPVGMVDDLLDQGIVSRTQIYQLIAPKRTLSYRRSRGEHLTPQESERLLRVQRIVHHAIEIFGDAAKARDYLNKPMRRFEGRSCIEMLDTDVGSGLVEELLTRIDHGIYG